MARCATVRPGPEECRPRVLTPHTHSVLTSGRGLPRARRAGQRGTPPGGGRVARCATERPGLEECRPRVILDLYHYPAERSSRRPSPRGAGGRAVRGERGGGVTVRSSRPSSAGPVGAYLPGQAASTTTRLSGAHGGRARGGQAAGRYSTQWELISRVRTCTTTRLSGAHGGRARGGQAAGRYVAIPSGAECAFLVSAGRRAGPVVHVWPGPGPGPRRKVSERAPLGARAESGP